MRPSQGVDKFLRMGGDPEAVLPARWDVPAGDRLGRMPLPPGPEEAVPSRRGEEIIASAAKVLARSGGGPIYFLGRSCDSLRDVLVAFLEGTSHADAPRLVPFSVAGVDRVTDADVRQWRVNMAAAGLSPASIARTRLPMSLCDLVYQARTFTFFHDMLRAWGHEEHESWSVIRRKIRFIGIVSAQKTSPKAWRWHQARSWTGDLPGTAVVNISMPYWLWTYLGDHQPKLSRSFTRDRWCDHEFAADRPRSEPTRRALAEAQMLTRFARSEEGRHLFVRTLTGEWSFREPWLRALVSELRGTDGRPTGPQTARRR